VVESVASVQSPNCWLMMFFLKNCKRISCRNFLVYYYYTWCLIFMNIFLAKVRRVFWKTKMVAHASISFPKCPASLFFFFLFFPRYTPMDITRKKWSKNKIKFYKGAFVLGYALGAGHSQYKHPSALPGRHLVQECPAPWALLPYTYFCP